MKNKKYIIYKKKRDKYIINNIKYIINNIK